MKLVSEVVLGDVVEVVVRDWGQRRATKLVSERALVDADNG